MNGQNFLRGLHNYARMVWPRMTEFGTVTQVRRSIFLGVSHAQIQKERRPQHPKKIRTPTCAHTVWEQ